MRRYDTLDSHSLVRCALRLEGTHMSLTLRHLSPRQRDSLRVALASLLERYFAYPLYFDFRRNASAHRPVDGAKRLEIIRYVQQVSFDVDIQLDVPALERWAAQTLLGFANTNRNLSRPA